MGELNGNYTFLLSTFDYPPPQKICSMSERYSRQLLLPEVGEEGLRLIRQASVLVVGAGGLGSPISIYLAGAGVGRLGIVDDDVVSITNLHRQILYSTSQVGQPKAPLAAERLMDLNPDCKVEAHAVRLTPENAEQLIAQYDIVVDGTDNFATRFLIDDCCARLSRPYVYGAVGGFCGQVSVFHAGPHPHSYRELYPDEEATLRMPHPGKAILGPTPACVGSVMATQALMLIAHFGQPLIGRLWTIDLRDMMSAVIEL